MTGLHTTPSAAAKLPHSRRPTHDRSAHHPECGSEAAALEEAHA